MSSSSNITSVYQPLGRKTVIAAPRTYSLLSILETGYAIVALLLLSEGILPVLRSQSLEANIDPSAGDPVMQALLGSVFVISLLILGFKAAIESTFRDKCLFLLMAFVPLTALWSVDPAVTARRAAALLGTCVFGMYFAERFSFNKQVKLLAVTLGLAAVLSIFFAVAMPKYGLGTAENAGDWQGIYLHKNTLGRMMVLAGMCFFLLARGERRGKLFYWGGFGLSLFVMGMSRSMTAVAVMAALLAAYPFARALRWPAGRWRRSLLTPILFFGGLIGAILLVWLLSDTRNISNALGLLGKDKTLTGRTDLWAAVLWVIGKRPMQGYGYGAFWETDTRELNDVYMLAHFQASHAHNGYFQLMLDVGAIGTVLFLITLALAAWMAILWVRRNRNDDSLWPIFYLMFMLLYNLTEPTILKHNNIFWMLYVALLLSLHKSLDLLKRGREGSSV